MDGKVDEVQVGRDAELIARVDARVEAQREIAACVDEVRPELERVVVLSSIPPMDPEETAKAVGARVVAYPEQAEGPAYVPRELCEERSVIEGFLEDGGLTEQEEALAQMWLRWDEVAHGRSMSGHQFVGVTIARAEKLRSRVYADLATSYSRAVGPEGSKVRCGQDPRRHNEDAPGGLVLSKESVRDRGDVFDRRKARADGLTRTLVRNRMALGDAGQLDEVEGGLLEDWLRWEEVLAACEVSIGEDVRETETVRLHVEQIERDLRQWWDIGESAEPPVVTLEDVEEQVERMFESGGALGARSMRWQPWLAEFVQVRGDDIEAQQRELDDQRTVCEERMAYLLRRKILLDGQRLVIGALLTAIMPSDEV